MQSRTTVAAPLLALLCGLGVAAASCRPPPPPPPPPTIEMRSPVRLDFASNGKLLVSDNARGMILTVERGSLVSYSGFEISGKPLGVARVGSGAAERVLVGNVSTKRVEVYDLQGQWQYNLGDAQDWVWQPTDIAVDENEGLVFVVDARQKVVRVFSLLGPLVRTIPDPHPDPDQLAQPTGIAVDVARREVLVSDYGDPSLYIRARVQRFSYEGALVGSISGKQGMLGNRFSRPQGLAVDGLDHVFLVDSVSGEVLAFDQVTGELLSTLGGFGSGPGQMQLPLDIVRDAATADLLVTNNRLTRIELFAGGGALP